MFIRKTYKIYVLFILSRMFAVKCRSLNCSAFMKSKSSKPVEGKIVGGVAVMIEQFPSSVIFYNFGAQCGGVILTNHAVLTAAHCFLVNEDPEDMLVQVGSRYPNDHRAKMHRVKYIKMHKNYGKQNEFSCDIGIIFLKTPIKFGPKAKKAVIVPHDTWMTERQTNFSVTGWGVTKYDGAVSEMLLLARLRFISKRNCERMHDQAFTDDMFCLYGDGKKDSCKGDSGGGAMWNGMLVGLVSHGDGCAEPDKPSVYTNVYYFRNWIKRRLTFFYDKYYCRMHRGRLYRNDEHTNPFPDDGFRDDSLPSDFNDAKNEFSDQEER